MESGQLESQKFELERIPESASRATKYRHYLTCIKIRAPNSNTSKVIKRRERLDTDFNYVYTSLYGKAYSLYSKTQSIYSSCM